MISVTALNRHRNRSGKLKELEWRLQCRHSIRGYFCSPHVGGQDADQSFIRTNTMADQQSPLAIDPDLAMASTKRRDLAAVRNLPRSAVMSYARKRLDHPARPRSAVATGVKKAQQMKYAFPSLATGRVVPTRRPTLPQRSPRRGPTLRFISATSTTLGTMRSCGRPAWENALPKTTRRSGRWEG